MPRGLPQPLVIQQRGADLVIVVGLQLTQEIVERVHDRRATVGPEGRPRRIRMEHEQVERLPHHAMVTLARFLDLVEMRVELLLLEEGGGINALQHLPLFVATPIGAGGAQQLEVLEARGVRNVRPLAQIDKRAVGVGRNNLVRPLKIFQALELERIVHKAQLGLGLRDLLAHERIRLGAHLVHLGLKGFEIFWAKGLLDFEVVVEAVLNGRTKADLGVRTQAANRRSKDMGSGVPQYAKGARILFRDHHKGPALSQRGHEVLNFAIHRDSHGGHQQAGADRPHHVTR